MKNENKKHLVFRNLILGLTLLVCIFIAVIAWFSSLSKADANGLTVKSKTGEGLEISLDGANYSNEGITVENTHKFPLITSNGVISNDDNPYMNFFLPKLNRTTGTPITEGGAWAVKREAVRNEDFLEKDVYFRSKEHLNVSLSTDSVAEPKKETDGTLGNISGFGDFSRNYIAGASRVGFYDSSDNLQFIWAPNPKYQLIDSGDYTKIEKNESGGSEEFNPPYTTAWNLPGTKDYSKPLYLHERYAQGGNTSFSRQNTLMNYDADSNTYYGVIDIFGKLNVQHMVAVSYDSSEYPSSYLENNKVDKNIYYTFNEENVVKVAIQGEYNADNTTWPSLYFSITGDNKELFNNTEGYDRFQVLISYNANTKDFSVEDFVYYDKGSTPLKYGGGQGGQFGGAKEAVYNIDTSKSVVIASSDSGIRYGLAVQNNSIITNSIGASADTEIPFVSSNFLFKPEQDEGESTYKFKNINSGKYLSITTEGGLTLAQTPAEFQLLVGSNGPLLCCNGFYIGYSSGEFCSVSDINTAIEIFQGNDFDFEENGEQQSSYTCLEKNKDTETSLNRASGSVSSISDLYSTPVVDNLAYIQDAPIVELKKTKETDEYYTGHIKVRIWLEGTDREAKTPLQDGVFHTILAFTGTLVNDEQTQE